MRALGDNRFGNHLKEGFKLGLREVSIILLKFKLQLIQKCLKGFFPETSCISPTQMSNCIPAKFGESKCFTKCYHHTTIITVVVVVVSIPAEILPSTFPKWPIPLIVATLSFPGTRVQFSFKSVWVYSKSLINRHFSLYFSVCRFVTRNLIN